MTFEKGPCTLILGRRLWLFHRSRAEHSTDSPTFGPFAAKLLGKPLEAPSLPGAQETQSSALTAGKNAVPGKLGGVRITDHK